MHTNKGQKDRITVWFYFYAPNACLKEKRILYREEWTQVEVASERLLTAFPIGVTVKWQDNELITKEGVITDGGYKILRTNVGEEVLLVMKIHEQETFGCGKLFFLDREMITIGTDFRYEIFYEYFSFLREKRILIYQEKDRYMLECMAVADERKGFGVYVNGRPAGEKMQLTKGDRIEILGLCILLLPQMLICVSYYGVLRIAERKETIPCHNGGRTKLNKPDYIIKDRFLPKEKIWKEECEIKLPEVERREEKHPLILTIGPSLTMVIPTLLMMLTGRLSGGYSGGNFYAMSAVVSITATVLSVFWMLMIRLYQNKIRLKERRINECEYATYLQQTKDNLADIARQNRKMLEERYPAVMQIIGQEEGQIFWNRYIEKDEKSDSLIRLGTGDMDSPVTVRISERKRISGYRPYEEAAYEIAEQFRYLKEVPIGVPFMEGDSTGFVGRDIYSFLLQMLVQVIARYGWKELRLVYFYHENFREEKEIAECLKWLPQIWQEGKKRRFLAGNVHEAGEILPYLTETIKNRTEDGTVKPEIYLFVIANEELVKGEPIYSFLTGKQKGKGYHAVFVGRYKEQMPGNVNRMVIKDGEQGEIMCYEKEVWERKRIVLEGCETRQAAKYMRALARERIDEEADIQMPDNVSFLELYHCQTVEELHVLSKWEENETAERIRVPIGIGAGRHLIYLDVHEKFHGPHGLIAGTTGSGKSELLQTYLLSLAVSFGPEAVNFFIIDYKGGGLGIGLSELLHCAGVISNLSGTQIKRALLSLKSENTRRQMLLSRAGVSHIDEYGRLYREKKVTEPMPHLILVVDEFAELKREEPEFMQEIISMAQIGRSLGIHLILATQKPAGTIDDKIWSNSRFRLCLRVADRQDSMDMLKRPEAAYITGVGKCYLQIGNNEIFEVLQTGYSKAAYEVQVETKKAVLLSATGKRYEKQVHKQDGQKNQLEKVVEYINDTGAFMGYQKAKTLWMNELSKWLLLEEVVTDEGKDMCFCIGRYDDPFNRRQGAVHYAPSDGHLCLCGMPASGKSTFLQTLLWQICKDYNPLQLQFLLIASESAAVGSFTEMPHCLGYIKQEKDAESFFFHLEILIKKRRKQLEGMGFLQAQKKQGNKLCPILVIIDNYGSFREFTEDLYYPVLERLFKEGVQLGIYLVLTTLGVGGGELPGRLFEKVTQTFTLAMSDKIQYTDVLRQYQIPVEPSMDIKGRGLCLLEGNILEFQVPLFADADDYERIRMIEEQAERWHEKVGLSKEPVPERFARIPDVPSWENMINAWESEKGLEGKLPIGYQINSGYIQRILIKEHFPFLLSGDVASERHRIMDALTEIMLQRGISVTVYSADDDFWNWFQRFLAHVEKTVHPDKSASVLVVEELADFVAMLQKKERDSAEQVYAFEQKVKRNEICLLAGSSPQREAEWYGTFWYELFIRKQCGMHMGGNASMQRLLSFEDLGYTQLGKREQPDVGYLKLGCGSKTQKILIPKRKGEEADDIG